MDVPSKCTLSERTGDWLVGSASVVASWPVACSVTSSRQVERRRGSATGRGALCVCVGGELCGAKELGDGVDVGVDLY
jgi:hypothetical protein